MKRYVIENASCGITEGGVACGPVFGSVVATIKIKNDKTQYLSLVEVQGFPNFYLTSLSV